MNFSIDKKELQEALIEHSKVVPIRSTLPILSCVLLMWLLNFALPSVFGSYYVLNFNVLKSLD